MERPYSTSDIPTGKPTHRPYWGSLFFILVLNKEWSLSVSRLVADSLPAVLERFETILRLSASRRVALEDQLRLYVFEREAKELETWLTSKKTGAESEDCGQDLEDVEVSL